MSVIFNVAAVKLILKQKDSERKVATKRPPEDKEENANKKMKKE